MTIKELRTAHMMTQSQFAERLGIDRSDLGKYENGKKKDDQEPDEDLTLEERVTRLEKRVAMLEAYDGAVG